MLIVTKNHKRLCTESLVLVDRLNITILSLCFFS